MEQEQAMQSAYSEYKADTNTFLQWLQATAKACGYSPTSIPVADRSLSVDTPQNPSQASTRLKGKERKLAKQAAAQKPAASGPVSTVYKVTSAEIRRQAEAIANSSSALSELPASIAFAARRAISIREAYIRRYARDSPSSPANARHRHFKELMQRCLDRLSSNRVRIPDETAGSVSKNAELLSNRFDNLELEHAKADTANVSFVDEAVDSSSSAPAPKRPNETLDFEDAQPEDEGLFARFCLFEDIHTVQKKIQATWERFADGEISLAVAHIATQAGLDIVKRLENEVMDAVPVEEGLEGYFGLAAPLLLVEAQSRGDGLRDIPKYRDGLKQGQFDEFLYISTWDTLQKFCETATMWRKAGFAWPTWPFRPLELSYVSEPDLFHRPEIQKRVDDDRFLTQILVDTLLLDERMAHYHAVHSGEFRGIDYRHDLPLIHDELSQCVFALAEGQQISLHAVFTAQIVLDVSHICGRDSQSLPRAALRQASDHADHVFPHKMDEEGEIDDLDIAWLSDDEQAGLAVYKLASNYFAKPPIEALKRYFLRELAAKDPWASMIRRLKSIVVEKVRTSGLDPDNLSKEHSWMANMTLPAHSEDPEFELNNNALFAGSTMVELIMCLEAAGLCIANTHLTIFTTAHLYNALRKTGVTEMDWPAMNRVIDVHKATIFANDIPLTSQEILRRLQYRTGLSPKTKLTKKAAKKVENALLLKPSAASEAFRKALEGRESIEHTMLLLENQLDQRSMQPYQPRTSLAQSRFQKQRQSPTELLGRLEEYLPEVLEDMQIDYITLTKTCNALMVAVQKALEEEHGLKLVDLPQLATEGFRVKNVEYMFLLLQVFESNCDSEQAHRREKGKTLFAGGEELWTAGRTFETFFDEQIRADVWIP